MKTYLIATIVIFIILVAALGFYMFTLTITSTSTGATSTSGKMISVVAAENFWGSLVGQLGGLHVNVTSIVSDPNADPHEYEANPVDAEAMARAQYIIVNGADYDTWALQLISASD